MRGCVPCGLRCHSFVLLDGIQGGSLGRKASAGLRFQPSAIRPSTIVTITIRTTIRTGSSWPRSCDSRATGRHQVQVQSLRFRSGRGTGVNRRLPHPGTALRPANR